MTHGIYERHAVTWRHQNLPGQFLDEDDLIKLRQLMIDVRGQKRASEPYL